MKLFAAALALALAASSAHAVPVSRGRVVVTAPMKVPTFLVSSMSDLKTVAASLGVNKVVEKRLLKNAETLVGGGESLVAVPVAGQLYMIQLSLGSDSIVGPLDAAVVSLGKARPAETGYHNQVYKRLLETVRKTEGKTEAKDVAERIAVLKTMFDGGPQFATTSGNGVMNIVGNNDEQHAELVRSGPKDMGSAGTVLKYRHANRRLGLWALDAEKKLISMKMPEGYRGYDLIGRTLDGGLLVNLESAKGSKLALVDPASLRVTVFPKDVTKLSSDYAFSSSKASRDGLQLTWLEDNVVTRYDLRTGKSRKIGFKKTVARLSKEFPGLRLTDVDSEAKLGLGEYDGGLVVIDLATRGVVARRGITLLLDTYHDEGDTAAFIEDGSEVIINRIPGWGHRNQVWDYRANVLRKVAESR